MYGALAPKRRLLRIGDDGHNGCLGIGVLIGGIALDSRKGGIEPAQHVVALGLAELPVGFGCLGDEPAQVLDLAVRLIAANDPLDFSERLLHVGVTVDVGGFITHGGKGRKRLVEQVLLVAVEELMHATKVLVVVEDVFLSVFQLAQQRFGVGLLRQHLACQVNGFLHVGAARISFRSVLRAQHVPETLHAVLEAVLHRLRQPIFV